MSDRSAAPPDLPFEPQEPESSSAGQGLPVGAETSGESEPSSADLDKALQEELESFNSPSVKRNPLITRFIFLGVGLALVGFLIAGGIYIYRQYIKSSPSVKTVKDAVNDVSQNPGGDDDKDGLTNKQEFDYKTDFENPDTDKDDLNDGVEVNTYHTDPAKSDTDGDGYSDGQEVVNGFNPRGAGKLRQ